MTVQAEFDPVFLKPVKVVDRFLVFGQRPAFHLPLQPASGAAARLGLSVVTPPEYPLLPHFGEIKNGVLGDRDGAERKWEFASTIRGMAAWRSSDRFSRAV